MWTAQIENLADARGLQYGVELSGRPATFAEVLEGWRQDADFRSWFNGLLSDAPYTAFRWETPAVTADRLTRPFEFVALDSPGLARPPEPEAFAEYFTDDDAAVATFANLRGDAVLIVPTPMDLATTYGHLASFVRQAPPAQRDAFWQAVGTAMAQRVGVKPVWLSTAGAGVSWLHVRLDDRPKYYGFEPYRRIA